MSEEDEEEDNLEIKEQKFKNYSEDSNEITIKYELVKYFPKYKQWRNVSLNAYAEQFSSMIKKNSVDMKLSINQILYTKSKKKLVKKQDFQLKE